MRNVLCHVILYKTGLKAVSYHDTLKNDILSIFDYAKFFHKIAETGSPPQLHNIIRFPQTHTTTDTCISVRPKSQRLERTAMYAGARNYNRRPAELKHLPPARLKTKLRSQRLLPPKG